MCCCLSGEGLGYPEGHGPHADAVLEDGRGGRVQRRATGASCRCRALAGWYRNLPPHLAPGHLLTVHGDRGHLDIEMFLFFFFFPGS